MSACNKLLYATLVERNALLVARLLAKVYLVESPVLVTILNTTKIELIILLLLFFT